MTPHIQAETVPPLTARQWGTIAVLTGAVMLLAIDGTVLSLAVPRLTADLAPSATELLWIGDVYSFVLAGLLVTMGNVADRIGRRRLLLIGSTGFGLASLLAAFAPTAGVLIAARVFLGLFGATIMPSTLSILRDVFRHPLQRTRAIAVWSAGATGGAAVGPLVGGFLLEHFWWGSVFLINLPVMAIVIVAGLLVLPESRGNADARIDAVSALLSIVAIVPIVYAVKHLAAQGFDVTVVLTALVGATAGWVFVRRQRRLATPLIDISLFRIPAFTGAVLANGIAIFALAGLLFFFSQYLQLVRGLSPLIAGLVELPATIMSVLVALVAVAIVKRLGAGRSIATGLTLGGGGLALVGFAAGQEGIHWILIGVSVAGLGIGLAMTLSTDAIVSAAPVERAGAASAISETAYELGVAMGIALLGSLQTVFYRWLLQTPSGLDDAIAAQVRESLPIGLKALDETVAIQAEAAHLAREAFTSGVQTTAVVAAVLLIVAALTAWKLIPSQRPQEAPSKTT